MFLNFCFVPVKFCFHSLPLSVSNQPHWVHLHHAPYIHCFSVHSSPKHYSLMVHSIFVLFMPNLNCLPVHACFCHHLLEFHLINILFTTLCCFLFVCILGSSATLDLTEGVFSIIGEAFCSFIPNHTAPD
ncbi:hypothetical protein ATANTOWER_011995 [Ataeniobius toweri]|uniref:Uncharacterized protein n=1 Tax=Ataeniobius toweri TaxID=208326 RepID=A0ABU7C8Z2_9TELE|nr:hypothetical protein [Ataeniobius toweri]